MSLMHSYIQPYKNYFQLSGRSGRKEYWTFFFVNFFIALLLMAVFVAGLYMEPGQIENGVKQLENIPVISLIAIGLFTVFSLVLTIPNITLSVRRLHDINKSGVFFFVNFIPFVGQFIFFVLMLLKGTEGVNRFDKTVADDEDEELFTFEDENNEELSEEQKEEVLEGVKELSEKDPVAAGRPQNLIIGYIEEITKKGLKEYIIGQTYKYFPSPHYTVYRIEKYNKGYIYEIHDGGKKLTHLKRVKEEFDSGENEIILKTAGNYVKVAKSGHKLDCMILQDSDFEYGDEEVKIIDAFDMAKMEEAVPLGAGTFLAGLMFLSFGIISLFLAVLFKYGLLNQEEEPVEKIVELSQMPHEYFESLPNPTRYSYIEKMYLEGNQWKQSRKELERPQEPIDNETMPPMEEMGLDSSLSPEATDEMEEPYRYGGDVQTDNTEMVEPQPQAPEVPASPYDENFEIDAENQPVNERGEPVNIFEVNDEKVINGDMVEKEVINDVNTDVLTGSPN
jgi:uncharacterized membrane protein YhaH (DUF805 family)